MVFFSISQSVIAAPPARREPEMPGVRSRLRLPHVARAGQVVLGGWARGYRCQQMMTNMANVAAGNDNRSLTLMCHNHPGIP